MPAASPRELVAAIQDAIAESGQTCFSIGAIGRNPRRFVVIEDDQPTSIWVYVWTLTPGGRPSLPHEYRIQMTGVTAPLPRNPEGLTILLGYDNNLKMFAGFDLARHSTFTEGSPSVQVSIDAVHEALQDGLAFNRKSNGEIAVGVRRDHFLFYCRNAEGLHQAGADTRALNALDAASERREVPASTIRQLPAPRRRVVQEVARFTRSAGFRAQVLQAYGNRCAVTRTQLRLVEAAHILPVSEGSDSPDIVTNGIALAPSYHRAFDRGLIYLDEDLSMKVNPEQVQSLTRIDLSGGLSEFVSGLGRIHLPLDRNQWPDRRYIRAGNKLRGIPT